MLDTVLLSAIGIWLGAMVFFAVVVAPTIFTTLEPLPAGHLLQRVFPRYSLFGLACLSLATLVSLGAPRASPWVTGACVLLLGVTLYARQRLLPRIEAEREAMHARQEGRSPAFDRLHRRSVQLNAAAMVLCVVLLYLLAA